MKEHQKEKEDEAVGPAHVVTLFDHGENGHVLASPPGGFLRPNTPGDAQHLPNMKTETKTF